MPTSLWVSTRLFRIFCKIVIVTITCVVRWRIRLTFVERFRLSWHLLQMQSSEARVVVYDPLEKVLSVHLESDVQSGFIIDPFFHCREAVLIFYVGWKNVVRVETPGRDLMVVLKVPIEANGEQVELLVGTVNLASMSCSVIWQRRTGCVDHVYVLGRVPGVSSVAEAG